MDTVDKPKLDVELLDRVVGIAVDQEKKDEQGIQVDGPVWNQQVWMETQGTMPDGEGCQTSCCIAGLVVLEIGGYYPAFEDEGDLEDAMRGLYVESPYVSKKMEEVFDPDDEDHAVIAELAGERLGLTQSERESLFYGHNSARKLREIADRIKSEREETT